MILSRSESPRLIILHSSLTTRSFIVAAFLATTFFASSPAASAEPGDSIVRSTIKSSFLDVAKTATASQGQTEHVEPRHERVGLSPSSDHEKVQNAAMSQVHAAAVSEPLRALQKELQTIVKQEVNILFEIHDYISMNGQNISSFILD